MSIIWGKEDTEHTANNNSNNKRTVNLVISIIFISSSQKSLSLMASVYLYMRASEDKNRDTKKIIKYYLNPSQNNILLHEMKMLC